MGPSTSTEMADNTGKLWGGRFTELPDETFSRFNDSFGFDRRLFAADVAVSIAHANALAAAGVLTTSETAAITGGLRAVLDRAADDAAYFDRTDAEDVHSFIEHDLIALIGDVGGKLHTGRSRNDQVATTVRLWLRREIDAISDLLSRLQKALIDLAERHQNAILPGYTHLQRAQPVLWPHWCLAYFEMFVRDKQRLVNVRRLSNVLPLGGGALAGNGFDIDREAVARELGFEAVSRNSLDAVSDRDFAVEFAGACSLIMVHLSRLAEDLILYCSAEFGFIELSDRVASGSSLMPQKKNPDALELLRGKAGRIFGHQVSLLTMLKGLPLAYNKDMQEDKEAVFGCVDTVTVSLSAAALVLDNVMVNEERARAAASQGYLNATELADQLVRKGVPFRRAHEIVGRTVLYAIEKGKELNELSTDELQAFAGEIDEEIIGALDLNAVVAAKRISGGTAPERVREALAAAKSRLENEK